MYLKTFLSHILISVLIIGAFYLVTRDLELINYKLILFTLFVLGSSLYYLSGYLLTKIKVVWFKYFSIAIIGILFRTYCILTYSEVDGYKHVGVPTIWSWYELFVVLKTPFYHMRLGSSQNDDQIINNTLEFTTPIFISFLQYWGGKAKLKKLDYK